MRSFTVRLYVRIVKSTVDTRTLTQSEIRTVPLRGGSAFVEGSPEAHPEAISYLRYLQGKKRVWKAVGADPDAALTSIRNEEHGLEVAVSAI